MRSMFSTDGTGARGGGGDLCNCAALAPGDISGDDQRGNLARLRSRRDDRLDRIAAELARRASCPEPLRIGPGDRLDVRSKRRIVAQMVSRMLSNDVDDGYPRTARVVQICETVGKTRPEMKESACRFPRHARIAVGGSRHHAFEESEDATHLRRSVKRCHQMHFRGAGVREAGFNPSGDHRGNQTFCPVHPSILSRNLRLNDNEGGSGRQMTPS